MGIFDNVSKTANRGVAAAGRTSRTMKLKMQSDDLLKQRIDLAAQLGAGLYEKTKDMPEMREGCESLFDGIADIDRKRQKIADEIEAIEAQARQSEQASKTLECNRCGNAVQAGDVFCSGCGKPVAEIRKEAEEAEAVATQAALAGEAGAQRKCPVCEKPTADDDIFCMYCGTELPPVPAAVEEGAIDRHAEGASDLTVPLKKLEESPEPEPKEEAAELESESESDPEPVFCMHCGHQIPPDFLFCAYCGKKL